MKARDVMTPNPITVTPEATLAEVWDLMREADIRHVPVVQAGVVLCQNRVRLARWMSVVV